MTTTLNAILDAQGAAQLTIDEYLAVIAEEERGDGCEFESQCYAATGVQAWKEKRGEVVQVYRCGYIGAGTVNGCPKRKRYEGGTK